MEKFQNRKYSMGREIGEDGRGKAMRKDKDLLNENKHVALFGG